MKVYGIHVGCRWEGGVSKPDLYSTIELAREESLREVKKRQDEDDKMYADDDDLKIQKWSETKPNYWTNQYDEVYIQEFNVVITPNTEI